MADTAPKFQDVLNLLTLLRRRLWVVFVCAIIATATAVAVSLTLEPVYRATTQVLIDPSVRQPFEDRNAPARYLEDTFVVDSQVTVLQSYSVLRSVVTQLDLTQDSELGQSSPANGILSTVGALFGRSGSRSPETEEAAINSAVDALAEATSVGREGLTFVINVSVDTDAPVKSAILSNAIVESYIADQNGQISDVTRTVEARVGDSLRRLREELRTAEAKVEEFKAQNNLQSTDQNALLTDQELAELNTKLTTERAALAAAEAKVSEIRRLVDSGADVDALSDVTSSPTIANLRQQYATAARAQANLSAELLPSHPELVRSRAQTDEIRKLIDAEVRRIANSAELETNVIRDRIANLETQLNTARTKSNLDQQSRIELQELQIEADTVKALYENLLGRTRELTEIEQISIPNARIISPAIPPESPIWPKKKLLVLLGAALGCLVGILLAIGRDAISLVVRYLLYPEPELAPVAGPVGPATDLVTEAPRIEASSTLPLSDISYLPHLSDQMSPNGNYADELLEALWEFRNGVFDHEMRPYWRTIFEILKQIQSSRMKGVASTIAVTSVDGNHNTAALSVVYAAASLRNFRVLLIDNNPNDRKPSKHSLSADAALLDLEDAVRTADLGINFLSLTHGRRKYQHAEPGEVSEGNYSNRDPNFDLIVVSEPPMTRPEIDEKLTEMADHVIVSIEPPLSMT
ncbi:GumC family protein [Roseibium sp. SCP14]|uniref:GumC family protein n=1 Tax=Roseibium sp. SCP14 TaxID=3141375 RepID=UPI0033368502